jgi:hypothetical protein
MPVSLDDDNIKIKYKDKSIFGYSLSFLFFAIIFGIISLNAPSVGKQIRLTE